MSQRFRSYLLSVAPAALLSVVAIAQLALIRSQDLAPARGSGFVMFASNDELHARRLFAWVTGPSGERRIEIPAGAQFEIVQALTLPSRHRLEALARRIADRERAEGEEPTRVRIQAWRTVHEPRSFRPRSERIREIAVDLRVPAEDR